MFSSDRDGGRDRRSRRADADRRRVADRRSDCRGARPERRRRRAVPRRQDQHVRLSRRSGDEGAGGQGEPEARQRAADADAAVQLATPTLRSAVTVLYSDPIYTIQPASVNRQSRGVHRQRDRELSPLQALQPRRLRAARPLAHHRQRRVPLPHRPERRRQVDAAAPAAARRPAERRRAQGRSAAT